MEKRRVLIIDDEPGFTRLLKIALEKSGHYDVREENDAEQAWLSARAFNPDIIFLDIVMPRKDGGEVAQQIRSDPSLASVPIVFLTAIVSEQETTRPLGGFPFLAKPVSLAAISQCIQLYCASEPPVDESATTARRRINHGS